MILFLLAIVGFMLFGSLALIRKGRNMKQDFRGTPVYIGLPFVLSCVYGGILLLVLVVSLSDSYTSNLSLIAHQQAVLHEYADTAHIYRDTIEIDVSSITDFRYGKLGDMLSELRNETVWYNTTLIRRRLKNENLFIDWFVLEPPEDLKLIKVRGLMVGRP